MADMNRLKVKVKRKYRLKDCPFCGGRGAMVTPNSSKNIKWILPRLRGNIFAVVCRDCGVNGGVMRFSEYIPGDAQKARRKAIQSWNRRIEDGSAARMIERVKICRIWKKGRYNER